MNDAVLQELLTTDDLVEKAAIVAASVFDMLPTETALVARRCVIFHWFDQSIIEALLQNISLTQSNPSVIYEQIISLPFIEYLTWGVTFHRLTREGLLRRYAISQSELLITTARFAASAYNTRRGDGASAAEAFFCYTVAGDSSSALKLLNELLEQAAYRENWQYISGLQQLQDEAERLPFVHPLSLTEQHWILRGLAHRAQGELEAALIDYANAIALNPQNALTYLIRGTIYAEQHRYENALAEYNHAYQLDPTIVQVHINRGIVCFRQQYFEDALLAFSQALQLDPTNTEAHRYYKQISEAGSLSVLEQGSREGKQKLEVHSDASSEKAMQDVQTANVFTTSRDEASLKLLVYQLGSGFLSSHMKEQLVAFQRLWELLKSLPLATLGKDLAQLPTTASAGLAFSGSQNLLRVISVISWVVLNWPIKDKTVNPEQVRSRIAREAESRGCSRALSHALALYLQAHLVNK